MKNLFRMIIGLLIVISGNLFAQTIPVDTVRTWMFDLAGDHMRGRANGSVEMRQAADYIAARFLSAGLRPVPGSYSFFHPFRFTARDDGRLIHEQNVIGYLEGADPQLKDECIVICAHYDHIGIGQAVEGDSIYNGADDNISGTCGVMGIAQALSVENKRPARSVLFISWAGEEMGLQGSRYYVKHPIWSLENTALVINFELLGRPESIGRNRYYLTGASFSTLADSLSAFNANRSWQMDNSVVDVDRLMFVSDNAAFAAAYRKDREFWGVVAHTFAMEAGGDHVHRPHDGPELIDLENLAHFIDYMTDLLMHFSAQDRAPQWTDARFHPVSSYKE
ncbi:M28 family peptidase [bacterium]|nr:M28 family peptidase [bacterium]